MESYGNVQKYGKFCGILWKSMKSIYKINYVSKIWVGVITYLPIHNIHIKILRYNFYKEAALQSFPPVKVTEAVGT
jgi:hypothetical protein